ncbi:cytochrome P450 [Striga asiatica]|uniref:Cytochrome P450 n=1 Tax=Striga asiatica TaxID=4170 RepID=A0A5A7QJU9_STRAF|nr:cytochrome P450 [Striga asiatica]
MLLPRKSMEDTELMGYFVPKGIQILVNAWAIHRDPAVWPDPLSFKPERFSDSDVDFRGQHFHLIPFGSGRRSCIGLNLGHRMVGLTVASLLQEFDWKLAEPDELDMREMVRLTLRKKVPLKRPDTGQVMRLWLGCVNTFMVNNTKHPPSSSRNAISNFLAGKCLACSWPLGTTGNLWSRGLLLAEGDRQTYPSGFWLIQ